MSGMLLNGIHIDKALVYVQFYTGLVRKHGVIKKLLIF